MWGSDSTFQGYMSAKKKNISRLYRYTYLKKKVIDIFSENTLPPLCQKEDENINQAAYFINETGSAALFSIKCKGGVALSKATRGR